MCVCGGGGGRIPPDPLVFVHKEGFRPQTSLNSAHFCKQQDKVNSVERLNWVFLCPVSHGGYISQINSVEWTNYAGCRAQSDYEAERLKRQEKIQSLEQELRAAQSRQRTTQHEREQFQGAVTRYKSEIYNLSYAALGCLTWVWGWQCWYNELWCGYYKASTVKCSVEVVVL